MSENRIIECRAVEPFLKNGYLLGCRDTGRCFYVDPGDEVDQMLDLVSQLSLELTGIVNTHAHMDHICGISRVRDRHDVPIWLHEEDVPLYESLPVQGQWFGMQYEAAPPVDHHLTDGQELTLGSLSIRVHHTPGHSPGHVVLEAGDAVFCGDTVFAGSIGRTDLPGGSHQTLLSSIRTRILPLGDEKRLLPGHGPETTVGRERTTNPFLIG